MKRHFNNVVSVLYTLIKFTILKVFHWRTFKFHYIERFSPNTDIYFLGKGTITLGRNVRAHSHVKLRVVGNGVIIIEDNASMNYGCMVTSREYIFIGKGVEFGPNVLIYDHDHDFRNSGGLKANKYKSAPIEIGSNTWIGANTIILKGTKIGSNCVVGAGCVISGEFPDNTLIVQKRTTTTKQISLDN
ncbi:MAG: galacturonic acid [Bacteroidetes bacterium]|nr:MAG: galacturonic acid [Bacteroidota bacterium]